MHSTLGIDVSVKVKFEGARVHISEFAEKAGVSARALRHYEDRGLLAPARDANGYRIYAESDVLRVAQITTMIAAGLGTETISRYIACAQSSDHGVSLEMCPDLRAELNALAERLNAQELAIHTRRAQLRALSSGQPAAAS